MSDQILRTKLIRLASEKPDLRPTLLPLLRQSARTIRMSDIDAVNELTDDNYHTEAAALLAKFLGMRKESQILTFVSKIQDALGHMPMSLNNFRGDVVDRVYDVAKKTLVAGTDETVYENLQ